MESTLVKDVKELLGAHEKSPSTITRCKLKTIENVLKIKNERDLKYINSLVRKI